MKKRIEISQGDFDFLKDLQHELLTQDSDGNAQPVYWGVMETRKEPAPEDFGDAYIYLGDDSKEMTLEEAVAYVDENIGEYDEETRGLWAVSDRQDFDTVFEFIRDEMEIHDARVIWLEERLHISRETGAFLTKRACKEYIENFGYNHTKPHTYAMTAYRNFELERLLKILKTMELKED